MNNEVTWIRPDWMSLAHEDEARAALTAVGDDPDAIVTLHLSRLQQAKMPSWARTAYRFDDMRRLDNRPLYAGSPIEVIALCAVAALAAIVLKYHAML